MKFISLISDQLIQIKNKCFMSDINISEIIYDISLNIWTKDTFLDI